MCLWCRYDNMGIYCGVKKSKLTPRAPARAVRPARWMYVCALYGQSYWITQCTNGKSNPRAATSVQNSTADLQRQKVKNTYSRRNCFILLVKHIDGMRVFFSILEKVKYMYFTWLHVLTKTTILSFGWRLRNKCNTSSFWDSYTMIKFWHSVAGVGVCCISCVLTYCGLCSESCASICTSLVWVAEKSSVWRCSGKYLIMFVRVSRKPKSSRRSASSMQKICKLSSVI